MKGHLKIVRLITLTAILLTILGKLSICESSSETHFRQAQNQSTHSNFLTGTYREQASRDQEIGRKALAATAHLDPEEQRKQGRALIRILQAPPIFAIEQYGTTITMNYPGGRRVPYEADGKFRKFRASGGETINIRAGLTGRILTIDFIWSGGQQLRMSYESVESGRKLIFTRTAGNSSLSKPVSITSEYERISPKPTRTFRR